MSAHMIKKIRIVVVLMLSFVMIMGVTCSQYCSEISGSDIAYVAAFVVDAVGDSVDSLEIDGSSSKNTAAYDFTILNETNGVTSGVSMVYSVELVLSEELPEGIVVRIDGISGEKSDDGLSYVFSDDTWCFDAGSTEEHDHTLVFTADLSMISSSIDISDISINILAEQVD